MIRIEDVIAMKRKFIVILFFLSTYIYSYTDEYLIECTNEGIVESVERSFRICEGSENYINKYLLDEDEINIIGFWTFDGIICPHPKNREYGPGISIIFYPNRYFQIYKEGENKDQIKNIVGQWKVFDKKLQVMFIAKIIINDLTTSDKYNRYKVIYINNNTYYTIFTIPNYSIAYVNTKPFDWGNLPSSLLLSLDFKNNDSPRSRLLFDPLGNPPGNITENSTYGNLLLNPRKNDKKYLIDLMDVWFL